MQNINVPDFAGQVDAIKYEAMRHALLKVLPRAKGIIERDRLAKPLRWHRLK